MIERADKLAPSAYYVRHTKRVVCTHDIISYPATINTINTGDVYHKFQIMYVV